MNKDSTIKFFTYEQTKNGTVTRCKSCNWCSISKLTHLKKAQVNGYCGYYNRIIGAINTQQYIPSQTYLKRQDDLVNTLDKKCTLK